MAVVEGDTKFEILRKDRAETQKLLSLAIDFIVEQGLYDQYMKWKEKKIDG